MNTLGFAWALVSLSLAGAASASEALTPARIKTSTVGVVGTPSTFFSSLFGSRYGVVSPDAPELATRFEVRLAKRGYRLYERSDLNRDSQYVIIRDYRGKAAAYVPQTSDTSMGGGGWGHALASLGVGVLVGKNLGLINSHNLLMSDANTVANLVQRTGEAYGNPGQNEDRARAAEGVKDERNLVAFRLCFRGQCAHALSAGDASLEELEEACFREGILKLAKLDTEDK
jgi:hypothetical protein